MNLILASILTMGGLSALFAIFLAIMEKRFKVEEDTRIDKITNILPGINCGGCGYGSCRALAEAMVKGEAPLDSCVLGGKVEEIAKILGVKFESGKNEKKIAFIKCGATDSQRRKKAVYEGVESCQAANMIAGGENICPYGCLGYGDCEKVCPFGAITLIEGLPRVDSQKCTGCGKCVEACPRDLISLEYIRDEISYRVACSSLDKGKRARVACSKACIGCGLCVKICPFDACHLENNLAKIDQRNCQRCGLCAWRCPTGAILEYL